MARDIIGGIADNNGVNRGQLRISRLRYKRTHEGRGFFGERNMPLHGEFGPDAAVDAPPLGAFLKDRETHIYRDEDSKAVNKVGEIGTGTLIRVVHEGDPRTPRGDYSYPAVVLEVRNKDDDSTFLDLVRIDRGRAQGVASTVDAADVGLKPVETPNGSTWSKYDYVERISDEKVSTYPSPPEEAKAIIDNLDGMSEFISRAGAVETPPTPASLAQEGLLRYFADQRQVHGFQRDLV